MNEIPDLFPMTVTEGENGVFTVRAANGKLAIGSQGEGEDISFTALAPAFGEFGSTLPYICIPSTQVSFLSTGTDKADINVSISFTNCVSPASTDQISDCFGSYDWSGTRS